MVGRSGPSPIIEYFHTIASGVIELNEVPGPRFRALNLTRLGAFNFSLGSVPHDGLPGVSVARQLAQLIVKDADGP